jgi:hypothetical protein
MSERRTKRTRLASVALDLVNRQEQAFDRVGDQPSPAGEQDE